MFAPPSFRICRLPDITPACLFVLNFVDGDWSGGGFPFKLFLLLRNNFIKLPRPDLGVLVKSCALIVFGDNVFAEGVKGTDFRPALSPNSFFDTNSRKMRVSISSTAFLLKAIARICDGGTLWCWIRFRIRAVMTVVLPLPGPAMTIADPVWCLTAFRWFLSSFIFSQVKYENLRGMPEAF